MRAVLLLWAGLGGLTSLAQAQGLDVQLAPSAAVACMTPPLAQRGEPEYPFNPWKRGEGGRVLVELIFTGATLEPEAKIVEQSGDDALVRAVKAHVAALRVPCLRDDEIPLRLLQEYVFTPDTRKVTWSAPADAADAGRRDALKCMAAQDGSKTPDYPVWARRDGVQGNILAMLRFSAADQPPAITLHAAGRQMQRLAAAPEAWAKKLRMPCLAGPVNATMVFKFRLEGDSPFGFNPLTFLQFLRSVKDLEGQHADFDTNTMGCPFDVKVVYQQPYMPNRVGQVAASDPRRQPLLDWLSTLQLELTERQLASVLGDTATLSIPCVKIDLKPKEKNP